MIPNELDKRTAEELVAELFPGAVPPVAMFKIEQALARHRGRVLERVAGYVMKCSKGSTISSENGSPVVFLSSVRDELRRMFEQLATRISPGLK